MKIGCNAMYPYGILTKGTPFTPEATQDSLRKIKAAGYDGVEYSHVFRFTVDEARALRGFTEALGLEPWSIHSAGPNGLGLGPNLEEAQAALVHCLEVCAALGARVMVVHPVHCQPLRQGEEPSAQVRMDLDRRILEPVCAQAQDLRIDIALENGAALADMEYLLQLREALGGPNVGLCVDTGHANLGDLGAPRAIEMAGRHLYTTHLQDNWGQRDDHLPPGQGTIDWAAVFAALQRIGYARTLMLELTDGPEGRPYDPDADMQQGLQYTRRLAAQYLA